MRIKRGNTYWGYVGERQVERKVNIIEIRNSGTRYINWTHIKKDGSPGKSQWSREDKFMEWVKGIFEEGEA